jgi:3-deoxy-D-manno-octulosonate 8-phosphate phosphatase (KDO 8-P phosphatase)
MRLHTRKTHSPRVRPARRTSFLWPVKPERLRALQALVLDCDGVLTKGDLIYDDGGRRYLSFDVRDGAGIALLARSGFPLAVLSGRPADVAEHRHRELGVRHFVSDCHDKASGLTEVCKLMQVEPAACAYVGDDLPDLAAFRVAGLRIAVADAAIEVIEHADWVTERRGGAGAVREVCEAILKARGTWQELIDDLLEPASERGKRQ